MAKRAAEPVTGHNEVVELNNDARWQARLDEARARRAEALKQQGIEDRPKRTPRKPWEEEAETSLAAKEHQRALDDDGLDFHDRMNALQKVLKDKRPEPVDPRSVAVPPVPDHARNWSSEAEELPTTTAIEPEVEAPGIAVTSPVAKPVKTGPPIDSFFDDPRFLAPDPKPKTPLDSKLEFVPISDLVDPISLARPKTERRPWLKAADERNTTLTLSEEAALSVPAPSKDKPAGMPFFLGVGLVALMAMPFFTLLPPMSRGPDASVTPAFGLQPALGITAAMVEVPAPTQSGEFVPTSSLAPHGPLALSDPRPPAFSRTFPAIATAPLSEIFVMPEVSRAVDADVALFARAVLPDIQVTQAMWEAEFGVGANAGRLPGVLAPVSSAKLIPVPRP
jgi:hypothetical protein